MRSGASASVFRNSGRNPSPRLAAIRWRFCSNASMNKLLGYMFQLEGDARDRPASQLDETLTNHRGANSRTGRNSGAERLQRRGNGDLEAGGPEQHHEKIEIRDAGVLAEQKVGLEFVREQAELRRNRRARLGLFSI